MKMFLLFCMSAVGFNLLGAEESLSLGSVWAKIPGEAKWAAATFIVQEIIANLSWVKSNSMGQMGLEILNWILEKAKLKKNKF